MVMRSRICVDRIDRARRLYDRVRIPPLVYLVLGFVPLALRETILAWRWHQRGSSCENRSQHKACPRCSLDDAGIGDLWPGFVAHHCLCMRLGTGCHCRRALLLVLVPSPRDTLVGDSSGSSSNPLSTSYSCASKPALEIWRQPGLSATFGGRINFIEQRSDCLTPAYSLSDVTDEKITV